MARRHAHGTRRLDSPEHTETNLLECVTQRLNLSVVTAEHEIELSGEVTVKGVDCGLAWN